MKDRLYYQDAYIQDFNAEIVQRGEDTTGIYVVLDQTAFYPTGGGQPCDEGTLNSAKVIQVEEVEGQVRHYLEEAFSESVTSVQGRIDWNRRFDHMQQHTGQHILSASFEEVAGLPTVGFHLGREVVTIDLETPSISDDVLRKAEDLANQVIAQNRAIEAKFVDPKELSSYPLRKAPTVEDNIRLVIIQDFDYNPCGGTHPRRTGEVGMIKLLGWEKQRGRVRLSFIAGSRVLEFTREQQAIMQQVTRLLTCTESELPAQVSRLMEEQKETAKLLQEAKATLISYEQKDLLQHAELHQGMRMISKVYQGRSMQELQQLAQQLTTADQDCLALFLSVTDKCQLVFARGANLQVDVAALLKQVLPHIGGKGGGKPEMAQGGGAIPLHPEEVLQQAKIYLQG
ncbi:alanyl-tRNA editing protein [Brevibacillus ginsengisoli]|uniref:alanyl-tRNA editing protein n=1 Tax=Brevibacillus ginsengisoli TaxID=363854 RepID=UPI003CF330CB